MIDPREAWQMAKVFADDKRGQAVGGGVLTAGVVVISLLIVGFVGIS